VRIDVVNRELNGRNLFSFFVWNFGAEGFFEGHDELDGVERVCTQIIDKRRFVLDVGFRNAQLVSNDFSYAGFDITHGKSLMDPSKKSGEKAAAASILANARWRLMRGCNVANAAQNA